MAGHCCPFTGLRQSVISEGIVQNKKLAYLEQSGILLSSLAASVFDV
jgi:hypothetical protein